MALPLQYNPGATVNLGPQAGAYAPGYQYNPTQQQFSNNATIAPMQSGNPVQNQFAAGYNALNPRLNYTVDAFNNAAQTNAPLALQMASQGGQQFINSIMQQNGWNQQQMNNWINQVSYEGQPGQARDNSAATKMGFGATMGDQTPGSMIGSSTYGSGQAPNPIGNSPGFQGNGNGFNQGAPAPTTLGQLAGGNTTPGSGTVGIGANGNTATANTGVGSIPGTQPNYPLDIGSYLNPMIQYQLQQGMNTINNSAAAAGNLNSGNTLKSLLNYGMGVGANSFNNAANIAAGQQNFGYGVDNNDRNFAYNAANNDRDFNFNRDMGMANLGLNATGQQSVNDRLLASLLSNNLTTLGQTQGTGTIGQNNALQTIITRLLGQLGGNQAVGIAGG